MPYVSSSRKICIPPKYQMKNIPKPRRKFITAKKICQFRSPVTLTAHSSSFRVLKRIASRSSCAKAFTTRMPEIDSLRCEDSRDHLACQRGQIRRMRPQIITLPNTMNGTGLAHRWLISNSGRDILRVYLSTSVHYST